MDPDKIADIVLRHRPKTANEVKTVPMFVWVLPSLGT